MTKYYTVKLSCGCMVAPDTGTPKHPDGNVGMLPCYAEYGNLKTKAGQEWLKLHEKSCQEYFNTHNEFGGKKR